MKVKKIKIGVTGSRWLGIECFKILDRRNDIDITHVNFPEQNKKVWWKDVVDENELYKLGYKITPWKQWEQNNFDLVFSILHERIFTSNHLKKSKFGIINLHPAPLPQYRGCNSYAHAIMNGDKKYRVTLHYIAESVDTGPIIGQRSLPIKSTDTGWDLYQRAQMNAVKLFSTTIDRIILAVKNDLLAISKPQNELLAHYYKRNSLVNKKVDMNWNSDKLYNFVRALEFPPFEPAYFKKGKKKIYLTSKF